MFFGLYDYLLVSLCACSLASWLPLSTLLLPMLLTILFLLITQPSTVLQVLRRVCYPSLSPPLSASTPGSSTLLSHPTPFTVCLPIVTHFLSHNIPCGSTLPDPPYMCTSSFTPAHSTVGPFTPFSMPCYVGSRLGLTFNPNAAPLLVHLCLQPCPSYCWSLHTIALHCDLIFSLLINLLSIIQFVYSVSAHNQPPDLYYSSQAFF